MIKNYIVALDQKILYYLNNLVKDWGFANKFFAEYLIYSLPIFLLWLWFCGAKASLHDRKSKKLVLQILTSVILSWQVISKIVGHFIHRLRPFEFGNIKELVFHRPTYSFPSDHAAALFSVAAILWFTGNKRLAIVWFAIALVISFFRISTGIHWPSDIVAGAAIGIVAAWLVDLFDKPLNIAYEFIIKIAQKLRLA